MADFTVPEFIRPENKLVDEYSAQRLAARAKAGNLYRVRRGLYLPFELWQALTPWEKYRVQIQAVHETAMRPPVFARQSAAAVLGLPYFGFRNPVETVVSGDKSGGQSSSGVHRVKAIPGDPPPWEMFGLQVTPPPQTARDLAVRLSFSDALPAMDKALQARTPQSWPWDRQRIFSPQDVLASAELLPNKTQRTRVARVVGYANGLSQSAGESKSRAVMILNGFPPPQLQVRFSDSNGLIGYPDFDWEEYQTLGEFDGYEKYSAQKYLKGRTPSKVVVEEKKREDRLRAKGYKVVRWLWEDLTDPRRLVRLLQGAGLPTK